VASAHVLWEDGHLPSAEQARFHTKSGLLTGDRAGEWIELDFPVKREAPAQAPAGLAEALGAAPKYVGRNQFDYLVEVDGESTVRGLTPNHAALAALPVRGVIVTSRADSVGYDFVSRFFAPGSGVPEDPVTGSAHCALGPFWQSRRVRIERGKPAGHREVDDLRGARVKPGAVEHDERLDPLLPRGREGAGWIQRAAHRERRRLHPEHAGGRLRLRPLALTERLAGTAPEDADLRQLRQHPAQDLQALPAEIRRDHGHPCDVAAGGLPCAYRASIVTSRPSR